MALTVYSKRAITNLETDLGSIGTLTTLITTAKSDLVAAINEVKTSADTKESSANKGVANGYASLDATAKVPASQLPSYVDDVLEYANLAAFPATGETGKIYVTLDTNKTYRWSGSAYVEISASPGSTDAVTEGATNRYFTDARAQNTIQNVGVSVVKVLAFDGGGNSHKTYINPPASIGIYDNTLPSSNGTLICTGDIGTITSTMIADGTIVNADISTSAAISTSKISGLAASATTDTTNANNITSGTLSNSRLTSVLGSIGGLANTGTGLVKITNGTASIDSSSYLTGNQSITVSGDASGSGTTSISLTLGNSGVAAGVYGNSSAIPVITVDAKGRITGANTTSVNIPSGSLSFSGDVSGSGTTGSTTTLTLGNSGVTSGTYGSSSIVPVYTVDAKGRITSASNTSIAINSSAVSGLANVATSGSYNDLSNKPTNISTFTNDSNYQTLTQVNTAIQNVVGAAPAALDTLKEIADQLASDESAVSALTNVVSGKANTSYVDTQLALKAAISSLANSATIDTTNASNISSGTLSNARLSNIPNSALANNSISINGNIIPLGGSIYGIATSQEASTSVAGIVQLNDTVASNSTSLAATANTVKTVYDLASSKLNSSGGVISGNLTIQGNLNAANSISTIGTADFGLSDITNISALVNTNNTVLNINAISASQYTSIRYIIQAVGMNDYNFVTLNVIHDGTNVYFNETSNISKSYNLGTFDVNIVNGYVVLQYSNYGDARVNNISIKIVRIAIKS